MKNLLSYVWGGGFSSRRLRHRALVASSLIAASLLPAAPAQAQAWTAARTATANAAESAASAIAVDAAGNQYVTGRFTGNMQLGNFALTLTSGSVAASADVFVAKYSPAGTCLWAVKFDGTDNDEGTAIQVDVAGNVLVTGIYASPLFGGTQNNRDLGGAIATYDIFLAKLNGTTGARMWLTSGGGDFGSDYVNSLALDATGNAYIGGAYEYEATFGTVITPIGISYHDVLVAKASSAGVWQWAQGGGGPSPEYINGIAVNPTGSAVAVGGFYFDACTLGTTTLTGDGQAGDAFVAQLSGSNGAWQWARGNTSSGGNFDTEVAQVVAIDAANRVVVAGSFTGTMNPFGAPTITSAGIYDMYVARLSSTGTVQWVATAGGTESDAIDALAVDAASNIFVGGAFRSPTLTVGGSVLPNNASTPHTYGYIAKLNASGAWQWGLAAGGAGATPTADIGLDGSGNVYAAGGFTGATATFSNVSLVQPAGGGGRALFIAKADPTASPTPLAPVLTGFTPTAGPVGTVVTVTGANFSGATGLTLGGVAVTGFTVNATGTSITFTVPAGALPGTIAIVTPGGTVTSSGSFCVQFRPTVTGAARCGSGNVLLTASGAPASGSYRWYTTATGGAPISGLTNATYTTPSLSATTTYYVAIVAGATPNMCLGPRAAVTATINATPTAGLTANGPTTFCAGGSVVLTTSGPAGSSYQFLRNGTAIAGATAAMYSATQSGQYTARVTVAACSATSAAVSVTVAPVPATPTIASAPQPAGTLLLTSSATTGNQWYRNGTAIAGAIARTWLVTAAARNGLYTVRTTSAAGCASAVSAGIQVTITGLAAEPAEVPALTLHPNPAHDRVTISGAGAHTAVLLIDATGRRVAGAQADATGTTVLDLAGRPRGWYVVRLSSGTTHRLVVE